MIRKLHRIAQPLQRLLPLVLLLGLIGLIGLALSLLENPWLDSDRYLMGSLTLFGWSLTLYCIAASFRVLPPEPDSEQRIMRRLSLRIRWFLFWLLALLASAQALAMLLLTWQLLRAWSLNN
jgi:hypothetical protein